MVVYTPRDEHEAAVCRSLFWASYNFSMAVTTKKSDEPHPPEVVVERRSTIQVASGVGSNAPLQGNG
jgi:hypothetical protein